MVCSSNVNEDSRTCLLNQVIGLSKQFPTSGEGLIPLFWESAEVYKVTCELNCALYVAEGGNSFLTS